MLLAVDVSADRDSKLTITALQNAVGSAFAPAAHQHPTAEISNFDASTRAQVEATLAAGANITLTPSGTGANRRVTIASTAAGGGGGVSAVTGTAPIQVANGTTTPAVSITAATGSAAGSMSAADKTKLDGVAPGATANSTDAQLRDRNTHTGSQLAATISDFNAAARGQVEGTLTAGANITLTPSGSGASRIIAISAAGGGGGATNLDGLTDVTLTAPATDQVLKFNGTQWVNAAAPGGGGGTVTQVTGGAGLTGNVTTTGALAVGAGTGITVNADDVAINRTVTDGWYAATSHAHGAITAAGAIGSTANLPIITGASGVLQAGSFGSAANTFCQGNDSRLSDARTPTAHNQAGSTITGAYTGCAMTLATGKLLGRSTAASGAVEEITLGTGLSFTGTTLNATATGGATNLDGLSDVTIGTPVAGNVLGFVSGQWRNVVAASVNLVLSNPALVTGSGQIGNMVEITQAAYDALPTKSPGTLYVIVG